jgi:hypothetical protein
VIPEKAGRQGNGKESTLDAEQWIERFAEMIGAEAPAATEVEAILDLAAVAAHSSERTAAPVACWLAGRSGRSLEELKELAEGVVGG